MNFRGILDKELLFETKKETAGALKVFYDIDIKIMEEQAPPPVQQQPQQEVPTQTIPQPVEPVPAPVPVQNNMPVQQESINEDESDDSKSVIKKLNGVLTLTKEDADNIQSIEDLIDFLGDKKDRGQQILDDLTVEILTSLVMTPDAMSTSDIIKKEDQIIITIFYGYKKDNSIAFKILKRRGVGSVSLIMLKDNEVLDSKFDYKKFNSQIIDYRNEWLNK